MTVQSTLVLLLTVLASISIVAIIILLGWFLIWKAFLSKFRLVRELLGQANEDKAHAQSNHPEKSSKSRKIRKD
ncbi:small integral membrane protein 13 [Eupeodes corollae]|uniref:small integral membrane protein 13 n=1 Tax=Eupeodes corollae TaxID=290404 RepID=UPI0024932C8E|nr:small integral membrane protein 13 [Eupeodes corollae]